MSATKLSTELRAVVRVETVRMGQARKYKTVVVILMGDMAVARHCVAGKASEEWAIKEFKRTRGKSWEKLPGFEMWEAWNAS